MKKTIMGWIIPLLLCLCLVGCGSKEDNYGYKNYVADDANLLSDEEEDELQGQCEAFAKSQKAEIVLVTTSDTQGKTSEEYADDYFDYNGYGYDKEMGDGLLLLIDMDNRQIWLSSSGSMLEYFNSYESCQEITDKMVKSVQNEAYAEAFSTGIKEVKSAVWMEGTFVPLLCMVVFSLVMATFLTWILYRSFKGTDQGVMSAEYYKANETRMVGHYDHFTHHTVTHHRVERNNSGGGGGGVHTSSSGNTHGGGGSHF